MYAGFANHFAKKFLAEGQGLQQNPFQHATLHGLPDSRGDSDNRSGHFAGDFLDPIAQRRQHRLIYLFTHPSSCTNPVQIVMADTDTYY